MQNLSKRRTEPEKSNGVFGSGDGEKEDLAGDLRTAAGLGTVLGMLIPWMNQMIFQEVIPAGQ